MIASKFQAAADLVFFFMLFTMVGGFVVAMILTAFHKPGQGIRLEKNR